MLIIILFILLLLILATMATLIIKRVVKDKKKQSIWTIVVDALLVIAVALVALYYITDGDLFTSGKSLQKEWIYEELPQKLWEDQTFTLADNEYHRIVSVLEDYGNNAIRQFQEEAEEEDLNDLFAASLFGLEDLVLLGSSSTDKKRKAQIERYKERYDEVTDNLRENMSSLLYLRNNTSQKDPSLSDAQLCKILLGTPTEIASSSPEEQEAIAKSIITNLFYGLEKPKVTSCDYNRSEKEWQVRLDNAPNQIVRFYKRDDGNWDIEWSGNKGYKPQPSSNPSNSQVESNTKPSRVEESNNASKAQEITKDAQKPSGKVSKDSEAEQLHSFFFNALCEPIKSLSDDEVLNKRLSKLLNKQQLKFIEDNISLCSPVYMKYDSEGNAVFSFYGTKNAKTTPETYTVNYTDVGGYYGWFDVITLIDGKRKQSKEPVKSVKNSDEIKPTVRIWNYEGTIGQKSEKKDISFTLYVDGCGENNEPVRGTYQLSDDPSTVAVWGYIKWLENATLFLSSPSKFNDFEFTLNPALKDFDVFSSTMDIANCLEGHCESLNADVRVYRKRTVGFNPAPIISKAYEGKLYNEKSSYPIEIHLAFDSEHAEHAEPVTGYYFYKNKGQENFIPLGGWHEHGNGTPSADFLSLSTISGNEDFDFEVIGDILEEETLDGKWTLYDEKTKATKRVLKIELKDITEN